MTLTKYLVLNQRMPHTSYILSVHLQKGDKMLLLNSQRALNPQASGLKGPHQMALLWKAVEPSEGGPNWLLRLWWEAFESHTRPLIPLPGLWFSSSQGTHHDRQHILSLINISSFYGLAVKRPPPWAQVLEHLILSWSGS